MSKKSYKRLQNRLYREIKRRIIAEQPWLKPAKIVKYEKKIDTLGVACTVPEEISNENNFIKRDLANQLATKLIDENYIDIHTFPIVDGFLGQRMTRFEARLQVVRPDIDQKPYYLLPRYTRERGMKNDT